MSKKARVDHEELMSDSDSDDDIGERAGGYYIDDVYIPPPPKPPQFKGNETGPRVIIKEVMNYNFKSYYGEVLLGPFSKQFQAIIGPNGSGKSNVIDSMLFVFGFSATRMRNKKVASMIHKSSGHMDCTMCSVEVRFCTIDDHMGNDIDDFFIVPDSEFAIKRTAYKSGRSEYHKIKNGVPSKITLKEVVNILDEIGIDIRSPRFLILQGEVESISLMPPKASKDGENGFLEYIEKNIGSDRLIIPQQRLGEKEQHLNNERATLYNRKQTAHKNLLSIRPVRDRAVNKMKTENDIARRRHQLYQHDLREKTLLTTQKEEALIEDRKELEVFTSQEKEITDKIDEVDKLMDLAEKGEKEAEKRYEESCDKFREVEAKDKEIHGDLKRVKKDGKELEGKIPKIENTITELEVKPESLLEQIPSHEERLAELEEEMVQVEESLNKLKQQSAVNNASFVREKEALTQQKEQFIIPKNEAKFALKEAEDLLNDYINKDIECRKKVDQWKQKIKESEDRGATSESHIEQSQEQIEEKTSRLQELGSIIPDMKNRKNHIVQRVSDTRNMANEAKRDAATKKSSNHVLNSLLEAQDRGELRGIHGMMKELASIDPKYDVAASSAIGHWDYIVVEDAAAFSATNTFLKEKGMSAKLIKMDKMHGHEGGWNNLDPDCMGFPFLINLLHFTDEKYKKIFWFSVRDTVVTPNQDSSFRVFNQCRLRSVIESCGTITDTSGGVTGGGNPVRGRITLNKSGRKSGGNTQPQSQAQAPKVDIAKLDQEVAVLEEELKELNQQLPELMKEQETLKKHVTIETEKLTKLKRDLAFDQEHLPTYRERLAEAEQENSTSKVDPKKAKQMGQKVAECKSEMDKVDAKISDLEEKINQVEMKMSDVIRSPKIISTEKKMNKIKEEMVETQKKIDSIRLSAESARREVNQKKKQLNDLKVKLTHLEEKLIKLREEKKLVAEAGVEAEKEKVTQTEAKEQFKAEGAKHREEKVTLERQLTTINNSCLDSKKRVKELEAELDMSQRAVRKVQSMMQDLVIMQIIGFDPEPEFDQMSPEQLDDLDLKSLKKEVDHLENSIKNVTIDMNSLQEYMDKEELFNQVTEQFNQLEREREALRKHVYELEKQRKDEFELGLQVIKEKTSYMYKLLTSGGLANLEYVDSNDPFGHGIRYSVKPNKKSWKQISNLSGGEKTLASLSLIFALHYYKPCPLYVMDEIDAALDFRNVSIIANFIYSLCRNTQFIIISLRIDMFDNARKITGIYKTFDTTKSVTINRTWYPGAPYRKNHVEILFENVMAKRKEMERERELYEKRHRLTQRKIINQDDPLRPSSVITNGSSQQTMGQSETNQIPSQATTSEGSQLPQVPANSPVPSEVPGHVMDDPTSPDPFINVQSPSEIPDHVTDEPTSPDPFINVQSPMEVPMEIRMEIPLELPMEVDSPTL